jgi:hypothetical protein
LAHDAPTSHWSTIYKPNFFSQPTQLKRPILSRCCSPGRSSQSTKPSRLTLGRPYTATRCTIRFPCSSWSQLALVRFLPHHSNPYSNSRRHGVHFVSTLRLCNLARTPCLYRLIALTRSSRRGHYRASLKKTVSRGILAGVAYVAFLVHWILTFQFNRDCLTGLYVLHDYQQADHTDVSRVLAGSVEGNMDAPIFFLPIQLFYTVIEALLFGTPQCSLNFASHLAKFMLSGMLTTLTILVITLSW